MPALLALLAEVITFVSRLFFLLKDAWLILKYNVLFLARIAMTFPSFLKKIGQWIFEFFTLIPSLASEGILAQMGAWINLVVSSSCCGFIVDAVKFPDLMKSMTGVAYFAAPFRLEYGIAVILCALWLRFMMKWIPKINIERLPRLPAPRWPQLPRK